MRTDGALSPLGGAPHLQGEKNAICSGFFEAGENNGRTGTLHSRVLLALTNLDPAAETIRR